MSFTLNPLSLSLNYKQSPSKKSLTSTPNHTLNTSRTQKTLTPQYLQKKFQDLYLENQRWTAKKQKLREEQIMTKEQKELKQLNPQVSYNGSNPHPFLKREMDWLHKKEKKIQELSRQTEKKLTKQCSFRPKISQKTNAILNRSHKTARKLFKDDQFAEQNNKTLYNKQKKGGCYRQIHMKQEGYKELQKANSIHHFTLITERRFESKLGQQQNEYEGNYQDSDKIQIDSEEDYIENIVIKTEEQNTFDSIESIDLKAMRNCGSRVQIQQIHPHQYATDRNHADEQVKEFDQNESQQNQVQNHEESEEDKI